MAIYKSKLFKIKAMDSNNDDNLGYVSGLASTFGNVDREGDVMETAILRRGSA